VSHSQHEFFGERRVIGPVSIPLPPNSRAVWNSAGAPPIADRSRVAIGDHR